MGVVMAKRIFLLIFSAVMGITVAPDMLTSADSFELTGADFQAVETVPLPEPEPEPEVGIYYNAPVAEQTTYMPANNIQINGRTIELLHTDNTGEDAGAAQRAWYYNKTGKYIYGHNYDYVFGSLDIAYDNGQLGGMIFTVTVDGTSTTYQVVNYRLYDYYPDRNMYSVYYNGEAVGMSTILGAHMKNYDGQGNSAFYGMSIMTCYAGSSQRLVVFANAI